MLMTRPKFMENEEWYYIDENNPFHKKYDDTCYRLTDKAPKEAVESYLEHCSARFNYSWGYVPEFVYEEYRKHMQRFEK